jgi:hypothetical protein
MAEIPIQNGHITPAEMERRRRTVRRAQAHGRLEGIRRSPDSDPVFEAFIRGEISATEIIPRLKARLGLG